MAGEIGNIVAPGVRMLNAEADPDRADIPVFIPFITFIPVQTSFVFQSLEDRKEKQY
jgi:hypothetical protein